MPAIRDVAQNYTTATTDTGMRIPAPAVSSGDLLVGLCSADTGATQVWVAGHEIGYARRDDAGAFTNYDAAANNDTAADVNLTRAAPALNDNFYFGRDTPFNAVIIQFSTAGAGTYTLTWEYWNGAAWATLPGISDGTTSYKAGTSYRAARFTVPGDWATTAINGVTTYWVRARISAFTSQTTVAAATRIVVGDWMRLFDSTSTVNMGFLYKYAGGSEPAEYIVAYGTAETANGAIASIRDAHATFPFSRALPAAHTYSENNQDSDQAVRASGVTAVSQSFAATAGILRSAKFFLKKSGSPTGNAVAKIYAHSGVLGTSSVPTGVPLATSTPFDVSTLTTSYQLVEFIFPWQYVLSASNFCIVFEYAGGDAANFVQLGYDASAPGHGGNLATFSGSWTAQSGQDACFYAYEYAFTTGTATTAKSNLPTMTTSDNNSLLLFGVADAATNTTPLIIEGPCSFLCVKDGTAHSDGWSWGWQTTAGTTPNNVGQSNMGAATGQTLVTAVVGINPPSGGATVIPTWCSADASTYITPLTGAAYNGDSVPATTVTSVFGSTLNGKPLAAGGATVTRTDVGVISYHAETNCTGLTTSNQWGGIRMTFAAGNKPNVGSKNLLFHMAPYLPIDLQTTDSVALTGTIGVAIGLASTANGDYKAWHVGGAGSSLGVARNMPVVINAGYSGPGMIQNTGALNSGSIAELGFMVSSKVVAASWIFGSCWLLDTTTVCGGVAAEPMTIPGIVNAAATGHERRSVISQGSAQFMIFGPIQIGDGGTNPVYLNLDGTALEFPQQYDKASKVVNYCSIDNICGLKYNAGAGDTIKHKNSVISSASRYFWGLHASSSTSATYDFSGLSVIGAGTISLALAITISDVTINDYSTLDVSGLALVGSTIKKVPSGNDSLTTSGSTTLSSCAIDVSTVASGNRWCSVASPSIFSNCTFVGGGGHAIRITTPGTYALVGNTFNGFGADGSNGAAIYNDSGGAVTINVSGGGSTPTVRNGAGASTTVNNNRTVTLTGLKNPSEVRVFSAGTQTEIAGQENVMTGSFAFSVGSGVSVDVAILALGYQNMRLLSYSTTSDATVPVSQVIDRQYANP